MLKQIILGVVIFCVGLAVILMLRGDSSVSDDAQGASENEASQEEQKTYTRLAGPATITGEVWADNWFALYVEGEKVAEDSVPITTERSFNKETFTFTGSYPVQLSFIAKDYIENDTGLEYIETVRQQMGDGGIIAQFTDATSGEVVGVTNNDVVCEVIHSAPLNKSCEDVRNPVAGSGRCTFEIKDEPEGWTAPDYDDSQWPAATVYSKSEVDPKDGYNEITWNENAKFIWSDDLEQDNTVLCRMNLTSSARVVESVDALPTEVTQ